MLWEIFPLGRNPMDLVHVKGISKRTKKPLILESDQCAGLIGLLPDPYRTHGDRGYLYRAARE